MSFKKKDRNSTSSNISYQNVKQCDIHSGTSGDFYCGDCEVWLCTKCAQSPQNIQHKVSKFADVKVKQTTELSRRVMTIEKTLSQLRVIQKENRKIFNEIEATSKNLIDSVMHEYNRLTDCLDITRVQLMKQIEQDQLDKKAILSKAEQDVCTEIKVLQKLQQDSKETLVSTNIDSIIECNKKLGTRIGTMRQYSVQDTDYLLYVPQTLKFPLLGKLTNTPKSKESGKVNTNKKHGSLNICEVYETSFLLVSCIYCMGEDDIWLGSSVSNEYVHVGRSHNRLKDVCHIHGRVFDISSDKMDDIFVTIKMEQEIRHINKHGLTKNIIDTSPLYPEGIYLTKGNTLLVCLMSGEDETIYPKSTAKVAVMKRSGRLKMSIDNDKNNDPFFSKPQSVTENRNSDICALDITASDTGRLLVFDNEGRLRFMYDGRDKMKSGKPSQFSVVRTDNHGYIFLTDTSHHCIHILSEDGQFLQLHKTDDYGMFLPYAISIEITNHRNFMWLGCKTSNDWNAKSCILRLEYELQ